MLLSRQTVQVSTINSSKIHQAIVRVLFQTTILIFTDGEYNSHENQTTCEPCDVGMGQRCENGAYQIRDVLSKVLKL